MTEATTAATAPNAPLTVKQSGRKLIEKISQVRSNGDKFNSLIHETAMLAATHAQEFGDPQYAQSLVMACPASMRRSMVILWFSQFTPIVVKDSADWNAKMHKQSSSLYVPFDLEAGDMTPFWLLAEQNKEGGVYDFDKLVEMVKRLGKTIQKKIDDGKVADADVESAQNIVTTISGINFVKVAHIEPKTESNSNEGSDPAVTAGNDEAGSVEPTGEEPSLAETLNVELKAA